jgi:acetyltransferase-like isoleucine patch superfamily enzyme
MVKKIFEKIAYRIYLIGKNIDKKNSIKSRRNYYNTLAQIDDTTILGDEAIIQNATGDKSKIKIGAESWIRGYLLVFNHGGSISIGDYTFIGPDTRIWSAKEIVIGNRVLISHNVNIHDNNSHPSSSEDRHLDYIHIKSKGLQKINFLNEKPVIVEDDVWIGFNCTIFKGVKIGKGAIIGSGSIITKDVPPYAVVIGNPQRIIKYVN